MFTIIGILVVLGGVAGGYLMEHGNLKVLMQPAELVIIGGAAIGTVLIANPPHILSKIVSGVLGSFSGSKFSKKRYLDTLKTMYALLNKARKEGLVSLEVDVEDPGKSPILSKYAGLSQGPSRARFCLRHPADGHHRGIEPFDLDQMIELDMDVHHHDAARRLPH